MDLHNFFYKSILTIFFSLIISTVFPNNIQISNISLSNKNTVEKYVYLHFNISWENSWKVATGPQNWDAAWVFIKFRVDGGLWKHATLSSNNNQHSIPFGGTANASSDGKGIFLYRSDFGSGTFTLNDVQLKWMYGADGMEDNASNIEIKVFGIEMVYVNEGSFYVGDGAAEGRLWNPADVITNPALIGINPIVIKSDNGLLDDEQLKGNGIYIDGVNGIDTNGVVGVNNPGFPTGYHAFYCMKHEITNEQFAEFLNTLTRGQQNTHCYRSILAETITFPFPINRSGFIDSRNCVRYSNPSGGTVEPVHFFCDLNNNAIENEANDGQNVSICNLGWSDGAAYADWAGLRPMTELEYEKACRGPENPIGNEYAWHTNNIFGLANIPYILNYPGEPIEYPQNPGTGATDGNAAYEYTTGHIDELNPNRLDGPLRSGIFATSSSSRVNAGASYYGILELSGGMNERCVTIGRIKGRKFSGTHGDGYLTIAPNAEGNATNLDWPGIQSELPNDGVVIREGSGFRGGDWNDVFTRLRVSDRHYAAEDPFLTNDLRRGNIGSGFRCVRTAE